MAKLGNLRLVSEQETENPLKKEVLAVLEMVGGVYSEEDWLKLLKMCRKVVDDDGTKLDYWHFAERFFIKMARYFDFPPADSRLDLRIKQANILMMLVFLNYSSRVSSMIGLKSASNDSGAKKPPAVCLEELNRCIQEITVSMQQGETVEENNTENKLLELPVQYKKMVIDTLGK